MSCSIFNKSSCACVCGISKACVSVKSFASVLIL
uniref:Uncharacterized protein n=1 Tax=Desulfurella acetivorans TaxID=33002 RepID=A0A832AUS5_DESAE